MYNLRTPTIEESRLVVGFGEEMETEPIGDLDVVLHSDEDVDMSRLQGMTTEARRWKGCHSLERMRTK